MNNNFEHTPKYPVQTLGKALDVITFLKNNPSAEGTSITEISKSLGMGKSGVHRILDTLLAYDYVEKAGSNSTSYRLGWGLFNAGNAVSKQHTLSGMNYMPILEKLCNRFSETINLGVLTNMETIIICKIEPEVKIRMNTQLGEREPLYSTAMGKLFLSNFTKSELAEYFRNTKTEKLATNTIVSLEEMEKEIEIIKRSGYALDNEEYFDGMICFAMPIKDYTGKNISGISISGPASRMTTEKIKEIEETLTEDCKELSRFLGYIS